MSEDFLQALEGKTLLKELLKNEDWEKQFRSSLKTKEEHVINYLIQEEVLSDMVQALINEEDRTLQEASEVLGIILSNVPAINDALVSTHLPALFQYLHRNTMNPRRLYFFLRVASFIFQNKSVESLHFAISSPDFTPKLVKHLSSSHIMQLMIHILNLEKLMKETNQEGCDWSQQTNLVGNIVIALQRDPSTTIEAVYKFLNEISNSYTPHSAFVKNILTQSDCSLPRCVIDLTKDKSVSNDAIKLLDEMILKIIMLNEEDEEFFEKIKTQLSVVCSGFHKMLESKEDLGGVIIGVKVIHALIKHRVHSLIDPSIFNCIDLCFRFPWANVLHNVIVNVIVYVFQSGEDELTKSFLEAGLLKKIIQGLAGHDAVGYRPHLRIIVSTMHASPSTYAQEFFQNDSTWPRFWEIMEYRDRPEWAFNYAESKVREELTSLIYGAIPLSLPLTSSDSDMVTETTATEESTTTTTTTTTTTSIEQTSPSNPEVTATTDQPTTETSPETTQATETIPSTETEISPETTEAIISSAETATEIVTEPTSTSAETTEEKAGEDVEKEVPEQTESSEKPVEVAETATATETATETATTTTTDEPTAEQNQPEKVETIATSDATEETEAVTETTETSHSESTTQTDPDPTISTTTEQPVENTEHTV